MPCRDLTCDLAPPWLRSWLSSGEFALSYNYSTAVSGLDALRRMAGYRIAKHAAHAIDQASRIGGRLVPAPGHMAVWPHQHERPFIERGNVWIGQRHDRKRYAT